MIQQIVEFGNRLLTFVLIIVAFALFLAVLRAHRRRELKLLALAMPVGVLAQGIIGGVTVRLDLTWWIVAIHLIPSMLLAWLAAVLAVRIRESDSATPVTAFPAPLRGLAILSAILLTGLLVSGTLVTGAGPHAGDARVEASNRLDIDIELLVHAHSEFMVAFLAILIGLLAALMTLRPPGPAIMRARIVIAAVVVQAAIGIVQYFTHVPAGLVAAHVVGAGICTAATGALWAAGRIRPLETSSS